jgi:hydrogenase maturation protein HypF
MGNDSLNTAVRCKSPLGITGQAIRINGQVQGVGFRPTVWRLAHEYGLSGQVLNDGEGVLIRAWGDSEILDSFLIRLREEAPDLARIDSIERTTIQGQIPPDDFNIIDSLKSPVRTGVLPDAATCPACLEEINNPLNRRYRYPFTNCIHCGPRFSIIKNVPYDRQRTTMSDFAMCSDCLKEYTDPENRRFHAQPNACPQCGPKVELLDARGRRVTAKDPIAEAALYLHQGLIVAVKGLGGYQLACPGIDENAVLRLRKRKHRWNKPFALMANHIHQVRRFCQVSREEEALLKSVKNPIVLLRKNETSLIANSIAPGQKTLGMMLPGTPLHHLLMREVGEVLVMTSGNISEEPIVYRDEEAFNRLKGIADFFLIHNRPIHMRTDDSVTRIFKGGEFIVRRARGYAPSSIIMREPFARPILACGGHLKNTFCLGSSHSAHVSHHIGDLENYESLTSFKEGIEHFQNLLEIKPEVVAFDLHPDYLSTQYAKQLEGVEQIAVQHHHAHIAAGMADCGLKNETVIGVAFDGTGYGTDGAVWGGEFLLADFNNFVRVAHLEYTSLPGGSAAIREPWRSAAACLHHVYGDGMEALNINFIKGLDEGRWKILKQMINNNQNCPLSSSMGRLFDAVASLLGLRDAVTYEGQAAVELEQLADESCQDSYSWDDVTGDSPMIVGVQALIKAVIDDILQETAAEIISARFHNSVAEMTVSVCSRIRQNTGLEQVVLGGGVFQNMFLLDRLVALLEEKDFLVHLPRQVPVNDGGISLGQVAIANARLRQPVSTNQ